MERPHRDYNDDINGLIIHSFLSENKINGTPDKTIFEIIMDVSYYIYRLFSSSKYHYK